MNDKLAPDEPAAVASTPGIETPQRRRRWPADRIICAAGLGLALLLAIAGRLAWEWIVFDIFNHFTLHFLLAALAFAVGCFVSRARLAVVPAIMLAGVVAIGVWPLYVSAGASAARPIVEGRAIRVMSFNTWLSNPDWRAVAQEVERHDPDILALIEFGTEKGPLLEMLAERFPHRTDCLAKPYCHMALLSKFAFQSTESRALWQGPPQILAHFGSELGNMTVMGVHTLRPPHFRSQFTQMRALARQLVRIGGARIVMGDFNATPFSRMARTFSRRSGLARVTWLPTWPSRFAGLPQIAIDHIFLSPDLKVVGSVRIGKSAGSDHYPVIADILLPANSLPKTAVGMLWPPAGR